MRNTGKNRKRNQILAAVIVVVMILTMVLSLVISASAASLPNRWRSPDDTIQNGVSLEGTPVGGMTAEQVEALAQNVLEQKKSAVVTFNGWKEGQSVQVSAAHLGFYWSNPEIISEMENYGHASNIIARYKQSKDVEHNGAGFFVTTGFDRDTIATFIRNNCLSFDQVAESGTLRRENYNFYVDGGQTGYSVNVESSADKLYTYLQNDWLGGNVNFNLDITKSDAKGSPEELALVKDLLGTFTTYYSASGEERCANIANGCSLIDGTILYPGEEFSVLKAITPFTEENGYYMAGSYADDEVVESLGGGICQVSTTLYNAVIRAELDVKCRYNHTMIVNYVEPSEDAAIAESANMDFKFVNTTNHPIYIEGIVWNKSITFNIFGCEEREPGRYINFESETLEEIPVEGVRVKTDDTKPIGYVSTANGHTGYKAQLWKVVTKNGQEVSREVFNKSTYNMVPVIITVGTDGTVTNELREAIKSEDEQKIRTAAANAKNQMAAAAKAAQEEKARAAREAEKAAQQSAAPAAPAQTQSQPQQSAQPAQEAPAQQAEPAQTENGIQASDYVNF